MKLYDFDGVDRKLELLPLAARRALDLVGAHLSLEGFLSLPLEAREELAHEGSKDVPDLERVRAAIESAVPPPREEAIVADPSPLAVPPELRGALGVERPIEDELWQKLSPLDRATLLKVARRGKEERIANAYAEIVAANSVSTHLRSAGGVHMVSVSHKEPSLRRAVAECWVTLSPSAFDRLLRGDGPKGDVLGTARLAGIVATKRTSDLIPLCHPLALTHADVDFHPDSENHRLQILCTAEVFARTGVEMEAMTGATVAALTVYDMLKSLDRGIELGPARLLEKSGGRSGKYLRKEGSR